MSKNQATEGFWTKLGVLATILSLVLAYLSYIKSDAKHIPYTPSKTIETVGEKQPDHKKANAKKRTAIHLVYGGDDYGCVLPIQITIGDKTFSPQGSSVAIPEVLEGTQTYQITGQVQCQAIGSCAVSGSGNIYVRPNTTYYVKWQNTSFGQCKIWLSESNQ